jgi:preprotein translocase subunit SecB
MAPFPITLERYFFTRLIVISNPDHIENHDGRLDVEMESSIDVKQPPEGTGSLFIAEQRVRLDTTGNPQLPYTLDIECIGFFNVDSSLEVEQRVKAVTVVAHNVLYAAVREVILSATARQAWGPLSIGLSVLRSTSSGDDKVTSTRKIAKAKKRPEISRASKAKKPA